MIVVITGSRVWIDKQAMIARMVQLPKGSTIIHGGQRGADTMAHSLALRFQFTPIPYPVSPSEWDQFGKFAGPRRNLRMLDEGHPERVLAFHARLYESKGTKHCVMAALQRGLPVELILEHNVVITEERIIRAWLKAPPELWTEFGLP